MLFLRRFIYMVLVLIGVSMVMFVLVRLIPGDPVSAALGPNADQEAIRKMEVQMGFDKPLPVQYFFYVTGVLRGKFGLSLIERRDVWEILREKLPATVELIVVASVLAISIAIPLGVISAVHRNGAVDHLSRITALFGISFPQFWIGIMLQLSFGFVLGILPITGRLTGPPPRNITGLYLFDSLVTLNFNAFFDALMHVIGPAFILSLGLLANIARLIRANMIDQTSKDYINVSRATGMHAAIISYKYMMRNAFSSSLTMIGFLIPLMLGTAFVVEKVFAWPGIARFGADAILAKDLNGIVGVTLVICAAFVIINFIIDELYGVLDPRIKLQR